MTEESGKFADKIGAYAAPGSTVNIEKQYITVYNNSNGETEIKVDWHSACRDMLNNQLTSNSLFHDNKEAQKRREQIYVPLALVERKTADQPQYEEKQKFDHDTFLENILQKGQGETQGKRVALIGEPGAGKTTLLQTIGNWILEQELGLPVWVSLADLTQENLMNFSVYLRKIWLDRAIGLSDDPRVSNKFKEQFTAGRVWLLLNGVDEIATSGSQTLHNISHQLSGWVGNARVVLTCRLNVWQGVPRNDLSSKFETFRLLDFDYPQQVEQFIDNWFDPPQPPFERGEQDFVRGEKSKGDRLKEELAKKEKARVRDLVQNPLRLAMLCRIFQFYEGSLPETKAELYDRFVDQFYRWKSVPFPIKKNKRRELNLALGKLAKDDIDSSGSRFRLRENFIVERLGNADDENSLFYLALQIGWLNNVAAESLTKNVYAFFHATFEEYFAALAIDDWDFFLPRDYKNKQPVKGERYRIFEPQWKQVILFWLGREDVEKEKKEGFIKALTEFQDGCKHFLPKEKLDRGFYEYRAYFLAAAGIAEFPCTQTDKIVDKVVKWTGNYGFIDIEIQARAVLQETRWTELASTVNDEISSSLGQINLRNENEIDRLVNLLASTVNDEISSSLGKINLGNENEINRWVDLLPPTSVGKRLQAAVSLWAINPDNDNAIHALVQLLESTYYDDGLRLLTESLSKTRKGENAISCWLKFNECQLNECLRLLAAHFLGKIGKGNEKVINALVQLLESTSDVRTRRLAAVSLWAIDPDNDNAIHALVQLVQSTSNVRTRRLAAQSLREFGIIDRNAINDLAKFLESLYHDDRLLAAGILAKIKAEDQMVEVVTSLKDYLSAKDYENNKDLFDNCYKVIWNCAKTLPYPEFYQAWHPPVKSKRPRWLFWCLCFLLGLVIVFILA